MINNFDKIIELLSFESDDDFYFVQILQRKKDNPGNTNGSNNSSRLIKAYYVNSVDYLFKHRSEMIFFANHFNARVGINLNKRSYEKTAFNTLKKTAEVMHNKNYKMVHRAWNTSCGVHNGGDKIWLLDIDTQDNEYINKVADFVYEQRNGQVISTIPSKPGVHLITKGFDTREFYKEFPDIEIHKNNPTNLYIP